MGDYQLDAIVKQYMKNCELGRHDLEVNEIRNMTHGDPSLLLTEKEILGSLGDS